MYFKPPKEVAHKVSLFLKIEYEINQEFEKIEVNHEKLGLFENPMLVELKIHDFFNVAFQRDFVNEVNLLSWKKKKITGMKVSWYFSEDFVPARSKNENFVSLGTP